MTFAIVDAEFQIPLEWKQRLITRCSAKVSFFSFTNASLIESGIIAVFLGGYFGIVGLYQSGNTFHPLDINDTGSVVKKFIVGLPMLLVFVVPVLVARGTSNAYIAMVGYTAVPTFGVGLVLFGLMDRMADYIWGVKNAMSLTIKKESSGW